MSHTHSTTKHRTFKHLNAYQRGQIEAMLRLGIPNVKIAKDLGIARSPLYAEIKRGTARQMRSDWTYYDQYFAQTGQIVYERHRKNSVKPSKFNAARDFIRYVEDRILKDKHSPDVICGCAKRTHLYIIEDLIYRLFFTGSILTIIKSIQFSFVFVITIYNFPKFF